MPPLLGERFRAFLVGYVDIWTCLLIPQGYLKASPGRPTASSARRCASAPFGFGAGLEGIQLELVQQQLVERKDVELVVNGEHNFQLVLRFANPLIDSKNEAPRERVVRRHPRQGSAPIRCRIFW